MKRPKRKGVFKDPEFLIYGLIDPRTRLIRYVGLSSRGLKRPKEHRRRAVNRETYCRRWVKSLEKLGLDYEVTILEVVESRGKLRDAERWWIAYGRACGWRLTNLTNGGGISEEALLKLQRRRSEAEAAASAHMLPPQKDIDAYCRRLGIPPEIERRCLHFFDQNDTHSRKYKAVDDAIVAIRITRMTATQLYEKWLMLNPPPGLRREDLAKREQFKSCCLRLFKERASAEDVALIMHAPLEAVTALQRAWWRTPEGDNARRQTKEGWEAAEHEEIKRDASRSRNQQKALLVATGARERNQ